MRHARLILNPVPWLRKARDSLPLLVSLLEKADIRVDLTFTRLNEPMTASVARAGEEGYDLVIVGGGDGTVSEVAEGLVGKETPLGILPLGTFNNIAHSLGIPLDPALALSLIARGRPRAIDVGLANGAPFFEAAGVGLDASLFPMGEEIKGGRFRKLVDAAFHFLRYQNAKVTVVLDGQERETVTSMVVVANGPYYGAGFTVAPSAMTDDGLFTVVTFECTKFELARHFILTSQNREHLEPCTLFYQAREVEIRSEVPLPAHADGKPIGIVPVTCRLLPQSLLVIAP